MIYLLCPDLAEPRGGVRMLYRHVDILNACGFSASIVHLQPGFRARWFANDTRVLYLPIDLQPTDVLVVPEIHGPAIGELARSVRKVIFNQNAYYTFQYYPVDRRQILPPYLDKEVLGTIVVSEDSRAYLSHAFPNARIFRIRHGIDPQLYHSQEQKRKQICLLPRKRSEDAQQIINILRFRGVLGAWPVVPIQNCTAAAAAQIMRQSAIFLSFSFAEGFGLPPAEAMACGCITIGYHGNGGREYFTPEHGFPIEAGDIIGFARTVEHVIRQLDEDPQKMLPMAKNASEFIRSTYSPQNERNDVVECWRQILACS